MLRLHFLNVGHGDCTIVEHPSGRLTMIDINNSQSYDEDSERQLVEEVLRKSQPALAGIGALYPSAASRAPGILQYTVAKMQVEAAAKRELTDPIEFMKRVYPRRRLSRFVLTHPDLDHMRGIRRLYETVGFDSFWDTASTKTVSSFRSDSDRTDWQFYQQLRGWNQRWTPMRGDSSIAIGLAQIGLLGGDDFEILSPSRAIVDACNFGDTFNDISIVMRLRHAGRSILLSGDAEEVAWDAMVGIYGPSLKSDFLKASHHGRDSGYHMEAVRLIRPEIAFVSVGQKPATDASSKYRAFSNRVASTRYYGDIELRIYDHGAWEWFVARNAER